MTGFSESVPIDSAEAIEACEVFERWRGRAGELPLWLREQFEALSAALPEKSVLMAPDGPGFAVVLSPELRALVANLRAREG